MKKITTLVFVLLSINFAHSQNVAECEKIVSQVYEAISKKDATPIMRYLSDDFSIAGHDGELARLIVPQLFQQLNVEVSNIKKISETQTEMLTLVYEADYSTKGIRTATFVFDKNNRLKTMELIKMEVQTFQKSETKVIADEQPFFTVPIKRLGNLMAVEAKLNGTMQTFIVDNGAPVFCLNNARNKTEAKGNKIVLSNAKGAGGAISDVDIDKIKSFELQGIRLDSQKVMSIDLSHLEAVLKTEFQGLIGYEIYKNYDLLFDYQKNTLTFIKPEATSEYLRKHFPSQNLDEVPITMSAHIAVVECVINGKKYSLGIDCGAESNLLQANLAADLKKQLKNTKTDTVVGADKNVAKSISGNLHSMLIGKTIFKQTNTSFSDISHLNNGYKVNLDGLIGYPILSQQPTLLSYKNKKLVFIK